MLLEIISTSPVPAILLMLVLALTFHILRQSRTFDKRVSLAAHAKRRDMEFARRLNLNKPSIEEYNNNKVKSYVKSIPEEEVKSIKLFHDDSDDTDLNII
jgi:hypothetical protein